MTILQVPEVDLNTCLESFSVASSQLCAGGEKGQDSCSGDSGGGLFIQDTRDLAIYLFWILLPGEVPLIIEGHGRSID